MKDAVPRTHRLRANNALQSLWAGPHRFLVWFAQSTLVSLLSVATRSVALFLFFFRCTYKTNRFPSVYLRVDIFVLSIPGV